MDDERRLVDESLSVGVFGKDEGMLEGLQPERVLLLVEIVAKRGHAVHEVETKVKAQHAVAGEGGGHSVAEVVDEAAFELGGALQQGVAVVGAVDVGVELIELVEQALRIGLPLGISDERDLVFGVLLGECLQTREEDVERLYAHIVRNDAVLAELVQRRGVCLVVAQNVHLAHGDAFLAQFGAQQVN